MLDNTVAAATAERATVVLPGTVYNYGPDAFPVVAEDSPQRPLTRKGQVVSSPSDGVGLGCLAAPAAIPNKSGTTMGP
jgi:hypothetical protein